MGRLGAGSLVLSRQVKRRIHLLRKDVWTAFGVAVPNITIRYDLRGKCAGQALLGKDTIRLNRTLLEANVEHFISQTVGHEFAHLAAFKLFGERGHGEKWKLVMKALGLEPVRCHKYNTDNTVVRTCRRFRYQCNCREHNLTSIRHNRSITGKAHYFCRYCKGKLRIAP